MDQVCILQFERIEPVSLSWKKNQQHPVMMITSSVNEIDKQSTVVVGRIETS